MFSWILWHFKTFSLGIHCFLVNISFKVTRFCASQTLLTNSTHFLLCIIYFVCSWLSTVMSFPFTFSKNVLVEVTDAFNVVVYRSIHFAFLAVFCGVRGVLDSNSCTFEIICYQFNQLSHPILKIEINSCFFESRLL